MTPSDTRIYNLLTLDDADRAAIAPSVVFNSLLGSVGDLNLPREESLKAKQFTDSLVILGPAGGAVLICPGNQVNVPVEERCASSAKCPCLRAGKAPEGRLCPIERTLTEERFSSRCRVIGHDPSYRPEDARSMVSTLTYVDIQEKRCVNILSTGEAARLTQVNVTDAISFTDIDPSGQQSQRVLPLTWERVLHVNTAFGSAAGPQENDSKGLDAHS